MTWPCPKLKHWMHALRRAFNRKPLAPETILTDGNAARIPQQYIPGLLEAHPLERLGTPEDGARAALFLTSEAAGWVTGVVLDAAGRAVIVG